MQPFDKLTTLLIDDSLAVLNSARLFGIAHLISVSKPDSKLPKKNVTDYLAIEDFRELIMNTCYWMMVGFMKEEKIKLH